MKILQVNKLYYPSKGGIEVIIQQIAEGLNALTDMTVLACQEKGKTVVDFIRNVRVYKAGSFGIFASLPISISFFLYFKKLIKNCDILHIHAPFPLADIALLLFGFRGKTVISWHSDIVRQKIFRFLLHPFIIHSLKKANVIIVAAPGIIDGSKYISKYREKCKIIPFGIKLDAFLLYHSSVIPSYKPIITLLFIGRLIYYKGCEVLLRAVAKTKGSNLIVIGSGKLETKLKNLSRKLNISSRIQFLGSVPDEEKHRQLQLCDIFVLPSIAKSEAFGIVQIEAMAYGKPVINTNLPSGVPDVSIHNETGLTVAPNDSDALAEAITWLTEHQEDRYMMGVRARKRVEEYYTYEKEIEDIFMTYNSIAPPHPHY